uniref:Lipocalin n=1 Tax=Rhipicephalus appendiculatus TaxID=34631 RepID=A0A131YHB4_RHIAP
MIKRYCAVLFLTTTKIQAQSTVTSSSHSMISEKQKKNKTTVFQGKVTKHIVSQDNDIDKEETSVKKNSSTNMCYLQGCITQIWFGQILFSAEIFSATGINMK